MEKAYKKVLVDTRNPIGENANVSDTSNVREKPLDNIGSKAGTLLGSSSAKNRGNALAAVEPSIPIFILTDTESETEAAANIDSDVEILEWIPGTDVKPVIKVEII